MSTPPPIRILGPDSLSFIPMYLKRDINNLYNISDYDRSTAEVMNKLIYGALTLLSMDVIRDQIMNNCSYHHLSTPLDEIIDTYYQPGDYVFNDSTITINDKVAFEYLPPANPADSNLYRIEYGAILCGEGCTNIIVDRKRETTKSVFKWLLSVLFSRLGDDVVLASRTFEDYWLKL